MLSRIISGGQTGVDRAALDAALGAGIACGGWCPKGRAAEDGPIDPRYLLQETDSPEPVVRTRANIAAADGTLVLCPIPLAEITDGTVETAAIAQETGKPHYVAELPSDPADARAWIAAQNIRMLNIAGPRESSCPGVYQLALGYVTALLAD